MNREEARKSIFDHFGLNTQINKLLEELHELIDAIHEAQTEYPGDPEKVLQHLDVEEEAADVMVLLDQLRENRIDFKLGTDAFRVQKEFRTVERIDSGFYIPQEFPQGDSTESKDPCMHDRILHQSGIHPAQFEL